MKGVIESFKKEGGFGFIIDEEYKERFFHISEIRNKKKFLDNMDQYVLKYKGECNFIEFLPGNNQQGKTALNIHLTDQIMNDRKISEPFSAKVLSFETKLETWITTVQGIKKNAPVPSGATAGDCGTYRIGYPLINRYLYLKFIRIDEMGWGQIDVRKNVFLLNNRTKITGSFLENLNRKLVGTTVKICIENGEWALTDNSFLIV